METANSAALLLQHLPSKALAGIDLLSFTTTPRFHGVKHIPPGLHFAFAGTSTVFSERHGIWFGVSDLSQASTTEPSPPLYVTKWDTASETLLAEQDPAARLRERANLGQIWRAGLTPYRQQSSGGEVVEESDEWAALTSFITPRLLQRILAGDGSSVDSATVTADQDAWTRWKLSSGSSAAQDIEAIPGLVADPVSSTGTDSNLLSAALQQQQILHLLPINLKQTFRPGATGRERTEGAQDRSWLLLHLRELAAASTLEEALLGELQFCFVMLLTLNNFSCVEQWQRLLAVLLTSAAAVATQPAFFVTALRLLGRQLRQCADADAGGLIDLADESGSVLSPLLRRFRRGVERLEGGEARTAAVDVLEELDVLEDYLRERHGWSLGGSGHHHASDIEKRDRAASEAPPNHDVERHMRAARLMTPTSSDDEDDEMGEFAPTIVELTAEQAELLGEEGKTVAGSAERAEGIRGLERLDAKSAVQKFVVDEEADKSDDDSDDEFQEQNMRELDANGHSHVEREHEDYESEEEEDTQDLEDMDSRY